jgi:hypothetical protein
MCLATARDDALAIESPNLTVIAAKGLPYPVGS